MLLHLHMAMMVVPVPVPVPVDPEERARAARTYGGWAELQKFREARRDNNSRSSRRVRFIPLV